MKKQKEKDGKILGAISFYFYSGGLYFQSATFISSASLRPKASAVYFSRHFLVRKYYGRDSFYCGGYFIFLRPILLFRRLLIMAAIISAAIILCLRFILFRLAVFNPPLFLAHLFIFGVYFYWAKNNGRKER